MRITAAVSIIVIFGVIVMPLIILSVYANDTNPGVFLLTPNHMVYRMPTGAPKWEQWLISMPTQVNVPQLIPQAKIAHKIKTDPFGS